MIKGKKGCQKLIVFLFISLFLLSLFAGVVSAQVATPPTPIGLDDAIKDNGTSIGPLDLIKSFFNFTTYGKTFPIFRFWESGGPQKEDEWKEFGQTLKYLVLILVLVLVYSAFTFAGFPKNILLKWIATIVVSLLATMFISTNELFSVLNSYTALGITLTLFFPILILLFFSMLVASKTSPLGIFAQKLMWVIYSVYLFIKTASLLAISYYCSFAAGGKSIVFPKGQPPTWLLSWVLGLPTGKDAIATDAQKAYAFEIVKSALQNDQIMLWILLITALAIFFIMVLGNEYVEKWFQHEQLKAAIEAKKQMIAQGDADTKIRADALQKPGGGA